MSGARTLTIAVFVTACAIASPWGARPHAQAPDARLTIADVENVSGLSGVKLVAEKSLPAAGGDLNFVGPEGRLLLIVNFLGAASFEANKKSTFIFHAAVTGIGDEAYDCPTGDSQNCLYVRKGTKAFSLATFIDTKARPMAQRLTMDQIKKIAALIAARL